jgi:hypothetical protein
VIRIVSIQSEAVQIQTTISQILRVDVLDILIHCTLRLSDIIVSDTTDSDHLSVVFYTLDPAITTEFSALVNKLTDVEQLRNIDCELNSLESKSILE